jgi:hypothetical protein
VQSQPVGSRYLFAACYIQDHSKQLPPHLFNCLLAKSNLSGIEIDKIKPAIAEAEVEVESKCKCECECECEILKGGELSRGRGDQGDSFLIRVPIRR